MRRALNDCLRTRKLHAVLVITGIILLTWSETIVFMAEILKIMAEQIPEIIIDEKLFEETKIKLYAAQLVFPIITRLVLELSFKRTLRNLGFQIEEHIGHYAPQIFPVLFMTLVLSAIGVITLNDILPMMQDSS